MPTPTPSQDERLRSMTGFGRSEAVAGSLAVHVEVKSVNHRFCQVHVRLPREFSALENRVETRVRERVHRGRVDVTIVVERRTGESVFRIDMDRARAAVAQLEALCEETKIEDRVRLRDILGVPGVIDTSAPTLDEDIDGVVGGAVEVALDELDEHRIREGGALGSVLVARADAIEAGLGRVEAVATGRADRYRERLEERVKSLLEDRDVDEGRILQEVAILADRSDIAEECQRIRVHLEEVRATLGGGGSVGRRLDFLAQELHREWNTLGTKSHESEIAREIVTMKEEVERLREQVQNVE